MKASPAPRLIGWIAVLAYTTVCGLLFYGMQ